MVTLILYHLQSSHKKKRPISPQQYHKEKGRNRKWSLVLTLVQRGQDYETYECKLQLHARHRAQATGLAWQGQDVDVQHGPTFWLTNSSDSDPQTI